MVPIFPTLYTYYLTYKLIEVLSLCVLLGLVNYAVINTTCHIFSLYCNYKHVIGIMNVVHTLCNEQQCRFTSIS